MSVWIDTVVSVTAVSLVSLIGVLSFAINEKTLAGIIAILVSFSAGALLGGAFIHLIPDLVGEVGFGVNVSLNILFGVFLFLMLERAIQWRHCHIPTSKHHIHPVGYMNLVGDALHNFTDGMVIAGSYLMNTNLGIATTIAVLLHEIPQELGDFGILLHAGFEKKKALVLNFASAIVALLGAVITLLVSGSVHNLSYIIIPITAGGFIYIAGADLIPEMQKECAPRASFLQIVFFIFGIVVMYLLTFLQI
jgi:zinc and cadmium transporter